jgi:hypothetical protein
VPFYLYTNTGESLYVTNWDSGEPWYPYPPSFPILVTQGTTLGTNYGTSGTKYVQMAVQSASRSGVLCNGNGILTDIVNIY